MLKQDPQPVSQWEILLWDIELQETKLLGTVDETDAYRAVKKAIWMFRVENTDDRERLVAVRPAGTVTPLKSDRKGQA